MCGKAMAVTRLECASCHTSVEG
ncbi:DUF2089-like zinc ribbon domain-containing protein, partial [Candidatus Darwinibacter acetoxidans]